MLRLDIINDGTSTSEIGNYQYYVYIAGVDGQPQEIARGEVNGHRRADPWPKLVMRIANSFEYYKPASSDDIWLRSWRAESDV